MAMQPVNSMEFYIFVQANHLRMGDKDEIDGETGETCTTFHPFHDHKLGRCAACRHALPNGNTTAYFVDREALSCHG